MGLLSRLGSKGLKATVENYRSGMTRIYNVPIDGYMLQVDVAVPYVGRGFERHPDISWRLFSDGLAAPPSATKTARDAMRVVEKVIRKDAAQYRPSAYRFSSASRSREKLYSGILQRSGSDYKYQEGPDGESMAVYSPSLSKELLESLAINAPLAGLGATALGYIR